MVPSGHVQGQADGAVELDLDRRRGFGDVGDAGHTPSVPRRGSLGLNGGDAAPRRRRDHGRARRAARAGPARATRSSRPSTAASFAAAIAFVVRIGFLAERADHHPDIDIRWRKVRIALTTHDASGLTNRDLDLAAEIEGIGA